MYTYHKLRRRVWIIRLIWFGLLIYNIIGGIGVNERKTPDEAGLIDATYEVLYNSMFEESTLVWLNLEFDYPCQGEVTLNGLDDSGRLLATVTESFDTYYATYMVVEKRATANVSIDFPDNDVYSVQIEDYATYPYLYAPESVVKLAWIIMLALLGTPAIISLSIKCKLFVWDDRYIVVYAGKFKKEIYEDDIIKDRMNGKAAKLEYRTQLGDLVSARFHGFNEISLKVNETFVDAAQ